MPNILTIAYTVEGPTDSRFLHNIIQRTFEEVAFSCEGDIDVYPVINIPNPKLGGFRENILGIAAQAYTIGIQVLCVHADADADSDEHVCKHKIKPVFQEVADSQNNLCKNLVAVIPVRMSESWMLADRQLLKEEIDTNKSNTDLGIARDPEKMADPKGCIEAAIRIANEGKPKKSRATTIADIYQPLGQKIPLPELERLASYRAFRASVEQALRRMNYLQ